MSERVTEDGRVFLDFVAQEWFGRDDDYIRELYTKEFEATEAFQNMTREEIATLQSDSYESDDLVRECAPELLEDHNGPFSVQCDNAAADYLDHLEEREGQ